MSQRAKTKDERFMLTLYELAEKSGDLSTPINRYDIGTIIGLNDKALNTICKTLLQANFIKKAGDEDVYLTDLGKNLVKGFYEF